MSTLDDTHIHSKHTQYPLIFALSQVVSGTITNIREASEWLSYTYLFVRALRSVVMMLGI